jgi:DNA-damage-inducible protein D
MLFFIKPIKEIFMDELQNQATARLTDQMEAAKALTSRGIEYWTARELMDILAYDKWDNFLNAIDRAKTTCSLSGEQIKNHFADTSKKVNTGSGAKREIPDLYLTRYACYLIAMNGDPTKIEISTAQTYFAVETRKQELQEKENQGLTRLELRNKAKDLNKQLGDAAKESGVERFGSFHNAGYKGLYKGRDVARIKKEKNIPEKDNILDRMGNSELGINIFRITQAEERLKTEGKVGDQIAHQIHYEVGQKTRKAVEDIGGTMPEDLPAEPHIKEIEKQMKVKGLQPTKSD